jgi:homoserine kinase
MIATVFAPGSIGNVGPGFDVLGLAIEGLGDRITVELTDGPSRVAAVTGRDAALVPNDAKKNVAAIAAEAWLRAAGINTNVIVTIEKGLALAAGVGGSGASSAGGAFAVSVAAGANASSESIMVAALEAESLAAGRHLDNIAATVLGGLALCRSVDPIDVVSVPVPWQWAVVLLTPHVRIETKAARAMLAAQWDRASWVQQMANTAAMVHAFSTGDGALLRRALDDRYAEPVRSKLIPRFHEIKRAALESGAIGCSISGSGPTIFAITERLDEGCAAAMKEAAGDVSCDVHTLPIAREGVRRV